MDATTDTMHRQGKPTWRGFLLLLTTFVLAIWIFGLPPAPGSLWHIRSQWPRSSAIALTTFCLLIANFWIFQRPGFIFKIQAVALWLLTGPFMFISAYSTYNSLVFLRFEQNMEHGYEATCDKYYSIYGSSDVEGAKKALNDVIDISLAERSKTKYYWRFNIIIAGSEARLAVIAESQGNKKEADRLFASASDHELIGDEAFRRELRKEGGVDMRSVDANPVKRRTPDEWREFVAKLDKNVRWKFSNTAREPTPTAP
jgi:hypothetical protein